MNNDLEQFSDLDLEGMAHGNNPVANAYRELLAFRRKAKQSKPEYFIVSRLFTDGYGTHVELDVYLEQLDASKCKDDHGGVIIPVYTTPPANSPAIPDGWIKCIDRMPENLDKSYQVVALCVKKYDEGNYIGEAKKTIVQDWVIRLHPLNFTHWMPLPQPPKEY